MKKCPFCAEEIQDEAIKCKHCGENLTSKAPGRPPRKQAKPLTSLTHKQILWGVFLGIAAILLLGNMYGSPWSEKKNTTATRSQTTKQAATKTINALPTTFRDFNKDFGDRSRLTELQKDDLFKNQYRGKYVRWTGSVVDVDKTLGDLQVQIKHLPTTLVSDTLISLDDSQEHNARKIKLNDKVTYVGRLSSWGSFLPHSLIDGYIIAVNGKKL